ncbi:MAG: thiamine diphosphokinase [Pseudomonadota bacterium]
MIIRSENAVTLVGASEVSIQDIDESLTRAPILVAADGGADHLLAQNHLPSAVIGDLDSLSDAAQTTLPPDRLLSVSEQETTDFEKCLHRIDAPLILALGFTGGRIDHELSVYNALARNPQKTCIVLGTTDLVFLAPRTLDLTLPKASRLSLFPMAPVQGRSQGLEWPIEGIEFAPADRIGTSNRVTGPVHLQFDADGMLVILPRAALDAVWHALHPG